MKLVFTFFACMATVSALAQQDPLYAQYINNPFVLNPAYAGLANNFSTSVSYRQQWTGFEGSPETINANGHISLSDNTMGAGLMLVSDKIGTTSVNEIYGSYAYRIDLSNDKTLSFGLQAGVIRFKTENDELNIQNPDDPYFAGEINESKPSIGSGIILTSDRFFFGFSVPRMLKAKMDAGEFDPTLYTRHFYAMGSYIFLVCERVRFKPSVLAKVVNGSPVSLDLNAAVVLYENYTAGLLARNLSTYGIFLQALIKNSLVLGYTAEIPTNKSVGSRFLTHEVALGLRVNLLQSHTGGIKSF